MDAKIETTTLCSCCGRILTPSESFGLGAMSARAQMARIDDGTREALNERAAWCQDLARVGEGCIDYDAWHDGWDDEVSAWHPAGGVL